MEKAVAYIRVSSQRQVNEGTSLDTQTKQLDQYVERKGYELTRIFREEAESAKTDQRPVLQELLRYCKNKRNGVRVVIFHKIDRFARMTYDYLGLKLELKRAGIELVSLSENIEDTPAGRFTETIFAGVAQFDNEVRAERAKLGMIESALQGRWVYRVPLGYRKTRYEGRGTAEPDPETAPIVQRAFEELARGVSLRDVLLQIRRAGVSMSRSGFYALIQRDTYLGRIHVQGKVVQGVYPFVPLVDEATFYRAQRSLLPPEAPRAYRFVSEDFPLRGSLLCSCGRKHTGSWSRGHRGERYAYYRCMRCKGANFPRRTVHHAFAQELAVRRLPDNKWKELEALLLKREGAVKAQRHCHEAALNSKIAKLTKLRDAVIIKNATDVIPDDVAREHIQRLNKEIGEAKGLIPLPPPHRRISELVAFAKEVLDSLHRTFENMPLQTKKDLLRILFPQGICFEPISGFRTLGNTLPERISRLLDDDDSTLVGSSDTVSNNVLTWLEELYRIAKEADCPEEILG